MSSTPYYKDFPIGATSTSSQMNLNNNNNRSQTPDDYPNSTTYSTSHSFASNPDFSSSSERNGGGDHSSQRGILRDSYPPGNNSSELGVGEKFNNNNNGIGDYSYEKGDNSVMTRGKVAAQMAAEGQIPKKEGLRMWRTDEHNGAFMKGGRGKCCGRVCLCSLVLVLVILISIITAFLLWTRPPDVTFNGVEAPLTGTEVGVQKNGFLLNFGLNIGVLNPNFFGVNFQRITARATYSTAPNIPFGGGALNNVDILKMSNTTIHFPFTINYTTTIDPSLSILKNIAMRCGYLNSTVIQPLVIDYTIVLTLKLVGVVINPSFSSSASFPCPLSESDINSLLGPGGLSSLNSSKAATAKGSSRKRNLWELQDEFHADDEVARAAEERLQEVLGGGLKRAIEAPWKVVRFY